MSTTYNTSTVYDWLLLHAVVHVVCSNVLVDNPLREFAIPLLEEQYIQHLTERPEQPPIKEDFDDVTGPHG